MTPNTQKPIIEVKKMNVTYFPGKNNEVRALNDINLEIFPGEFIIFFGPSGCGKSTLLYSISGLERNITGDILVKGDNLRTMNEKTRENFHQKTIGMVFQAYYLIPSLSVLQNIALPQMALNGSIKEREERGQKLLDQFGVGKQGEKLPTELSGGQQQRVAICPPVMNAPPSAASRAASGAGTEATSASAAASASASSAAAAAFAALPALPPRRL